ncbi:cyclin B Clb4p-like protein [Cryptosporidium canis]|uniref:Cyclin B Clb4p-like protein n=1 Tax=Cryptosporidium canis TaxID=195482 RepID=A0A9D5HUW2_9CRYT|nr:cyclin B Clb4p-like protein [Cryptosporidium canis]
MRSERLNKVIQGHSSTSTNNTILYGENCRKLVNQSNLQVINSQDIKNAGVTNKPITRSMSSTGNINMSSSSACNQRHSSKLIDNSKNQNTAKPGSRTTLASSYNEKTCKENVNKLNTFAEKQLKAVGVQYTNTLEKVISADMNNTDASFFSEYAEAIYQTSRDLESKKESLLFTASQVVSAQPSVGKQILEWKRSGVNLLFGLQITFNVPDEVTVIANSMLDRILGLKHFQRASEMTLVSATCFWIALKYEAAYVQGENLKIPPLPALSDVAEKCGLNIAAILFCEGVVLDALDWSIEFPKPSDYIKRYCLVFKDQYAGNKASRVESLSIYLSHLAIHEPAMMGVCASKLACACLMLAHKIEGVEESWSPAVEYYTGYTRDSLKELTRYMISNLRTIRNTENGESHASPSHYQNVRKKWWNSWGSNEWG